MNLDTLLESFKHSGYPLDEERVVYLVHLEASHPGVIARLYTYINAYSTDKGIVLYKHMNFLLRLLEMESSFPPNLTASLNAYLHENPLKSSALIEKLYERLWKEISEQTHSLKLTYHNGFHGLEVTMRTRLGSDYLQLFTDNEPVSQFLRFLLLTAAKYHDCIQWPKGHVYQVGGCTTAEEDTAKHLAEVVIQAMELDSHENEPIVTFLRFFFPLLIGPGTTVLFARDTIINLSQIFDELRTVLNFPSKSLGNERLISSLWIATEILSVADKASFCSQQMMEGEYARRDVNIGTLLNLEQSRFASILKAIDCSDWYYPEQSFEFNFYVASVMKVSQVEMELELNSTLPEAQRLRDYIRDGQHLYRDAAYEKLQAHLSQVLGVSMLYKDFEDLYFRHLAVEVGFFTKLSHICTATRARLEKFGGLDTFGLSIYSKDVNDLKTPSEDEVCVLGPSFIDPEVPLKEVKLLNCLREKMTTWTVEEKKQLIQELLFFSMTQSGIYYTNHPSCIAEIEPLSPLGISLSPIKIPDETNSNRFFREPSQPTLVLPFEDVATPLAGQEEAGNASILEGVQPK